MTTTRKRKNNDSESALLSSNDICTGLYEEQLREQAVQFVPSAVRKLAELAESGPAVVARQACNDLIEHARKRPVTRVEDLGNRLGDGKLNINIQLIGPEGAPLMVPATRAPIAIPAPVADDVEDAELVDLPDDGPQPDPMLNIKIKGLGDAS